MQLEEAIGVCLRERGWTLAVAESCTGGLLGGRLTSVAGSSAYFAGGVIAYANVVKRDLLGVDAESLASDGAVSAVVAGQMADRVRRRLAADIGVGVTGIAGPGGATPGKPVGLVYVALAYAGGKRVCRFVLPGDRSAVREAAVEAAMSLLWEYLQGRDQDG
jgi:PncC family amidohydrolase